jgi:hypothetical protein
MVPEDASTRGPPARLRFPKFNAGTFCEKGDERVTVLEQSKVELEELLYKKLPVTVRFDPVEVEKAPFEETVKLLQVLEPVMLSALV